MPAEDAAHDDGALATALEAAIARGAAAHPTIAVAPARVAAYLGAHADETAPPSLWLAARNLPDVHLACAIAAGNEAAHREADSRLVPELARAASRILEREAAADVVADVREKLFVGVDARGPRISDYGGHGELVVWLRVIAVRAAVSAARRTRATVPADDHLWEVASPSADPALAVIKRESAALIKAEFHAALATLSPRQRNLLRQHLLDGLTIDELGAMYQVHRVTAARWLAAARSDLWARVRAGLRERLALSDSAIGAMLDDIRSTLDLSIERGLR